MTVTNDDRRFAHEQAQRIFAAHVAQMDDVSNHFAQNFSYVESLRRGILTECAFAREFGAFVDADLHQYGDGGADFRLPFRIDHGRTQWFPVQVKSKSVRVTWPALMASGTHLRVPAREIRPLTIYVFGIYLEQSDDAAVLRWDWGRTLISQRETAVYENTTQRVVSYTRRFEDLRELADLKLRLVQREALLATPLGQVTLARHPDAPQPAA